MRTESGGLVGSKMTCQLSSPVSARTRLRFFLPVEDLAPGQIGLFVVGGHDADAMG